MAASLELPTGTVTFLLTDIEGSTRLWEGEPGKSGGGRRLLGSRWRAKGKSGQRCGGKQRTESADLTDQASPPRLRIRPAGHRLPYEAHGICSLFGSL